MRRRLLTIAIFLLAGAVVNVAVAWGCAMYFNADEYDGYNYVNEAHRTWWRENAPSTWTDEPADVTYHRGFGTQGLLYTEYSSGQPLGNNVTRFYAGFPFRCLEGTNWVDLATGKVWRDSVSVVLQRWWHPSGNLPLRVRWVETAANILIYAGVFVGLQLVYLHIRGRIRLKRNLCPTCAYRMGESAVCSECGHALPREIQDMKRERFLSHLGSATRVVAAASLFWIAAVIASIVWLAVFTYELGTRPGIAPLYFFSGWLIETVAIVCIGLPLVNACLFFVVLWLSRPFAKEHAWRLYTLSVVFGIASLIGWLVFGENRYLGHIYLPILPALSGLISAAGLWTAIALKFLRRPRVASACAKCGYDLRGSPRPTCTECGKNLPKRVSPAT